MNFLLLQVHHGPDLPDSFFVSRDCGICARKLFLTCASKAICMFQLVGKEECIRRLRELVLEAKKSAGIDEGVPLKALV